MSVSLKRPESVDLARRDRPVLSVLETHLHADERAGRVA
jgi:hypothetical protein